MKKWECTVCGYIHEGEEHPEIGPVFGADPSKSVEIVAEENGEKKINNKRIISNGSTGRRSGTGSPKRN